MNTYLPTSFPRKEMTKVQPHAARLPQIIWLPSWGGSAGAAWR